MYIYTSGRHNGLRTIAHEQLLAGQSLTMSTAREAICSLSRTLQMIHSQSTALNAKKYAILNETVDFGRLVFHSVQDDIVFVSELCEGRPL